MPHFLRRIASSFTQSSETNQLETPIFDTPLTKQTVEELEVLQREILTLYNKVIDQKETAKQNYCPAAARLAHHQARSQRLKLNQVEQELYRRLPLIAKVVKKAKSSPPNNTTCLSLILPPLLPLLPPPTHVSKANDLPYLATLKHCQPSKPLTSSPPTKRLRESAHPDTIFAINELAKVSRAHQQEEREICLARQRSRVRQTMATALLDQLQSWGLERELYDVLREHRSKSSTVQKLSVPSLIDPPFQSAVPARPPAYRRAVQFSPIIDNSPSPQISPPASTPSRSPIPTPTPRRSRNTTTHQ
ncbi:hypothetical protein CVT25_008542 [Psilocybe cyanescens]|uniref:Uncharacterized protein n=1 Tax=Psilocybe cyanescens TaxID=93625 RepID=A0A409XRX6_PSICY|nr:hypothetical protein CVT25_008542 [Psilocybe cyanescens]